MTVAPTTNKNLDLIKDLFYLHNKTNKEIALKVLLATASLIAGIACILFLRVSFLDVGIGLIVLSGLAFIYYQHRYRHTSKIFTRALEAINNTFKTRTS